MKKLNFICVSLLIAIMFVFQSCYVYKFTEGKGAQGNNVVKIKNDYFIAGLIKGKTASYKDMVGNATDYDVQIKHSFVDCILCGITLDIYCPTTTTITK